MIDVEMWFLWCKGVVFGMILATIIKEFGEWVRSRRTKRALDGVPPQEAGDLTPADVHEKMWRLRQSRRK